MLFSVPSSTAPYLIGLVITPIVYWMRSQDVSLTAIAVFSIVLILLRIAVVYFFKQRDPKGDNVHSTVYWSLLFAIGAFYSLTIAALVARAFFVGEVLSIGVAVVTASGLITGIVIRASAVPRMAVPHLLCAFVPLIIFVASLPDRAYLVIAFLLGLWCLLRATEFGGPSAYESAAIGGTSVIAIGAKGLSYGARQQSQF
jgi:multisubunit Na+/H+ antiporter MnhB subunit